MYRVLLVFPFASAHEKPASFSRSTPYTVNLLSSSGEVTYMNALSAAYFDRNLVDDPVPLIEEDLRKAGGILRSIPKDTHLNRSISSIKLFAEGLRGKRYMPSGHYFSAGALEHSLKMYPVTCEMLGLKCEGQVCPSVAYRYLWMALGVGTDSVLHDGVDWFDIRLVHTEGYGVWKGNVIPLMPGYWKAVSFAFEPIRFALASGLCKFEVTLSPTNTRTWALTWISEVQQHNVVQRDIFPVRVLRNDTISWRNTLYKSDVEGGTSLRAALRSEKYTIAGQYIIPLRSGRGLLAVGQEDSIAMTTFSSLIVYVHAVRNFTNFEPSEYYFDGPTKRELNIRQMIYDAVGQKPCAIWVSRDAERFLHTALRTQEDRLSAFYDYSVVHGYTFYKSSVEYGKW